MAAPVARHDLRRAAPGGAIKRPVIALTSGEPAGIGPELCERIAAEKFAARLVVIGDRSLFKSGEVDHIPLRRPRVPGKLDTANSPYVLALLDRAIAGCLAGEFDAMVTAPVQKSVINDAGIAFTGHTEYLAEHAGAPHVVMMLVGGGLRVALATTHLALSDVPRAIKRDDLLKTLRVLHADLQKRFHIAHPAHPGRRPESAQRRGRPFRPRGRRRDRAGDRRSQGRRHRRLAARCLPTRCSCRTV